VHNSPLGHQIKALTSTFVRLRLARHANALAMAVGAHAPRGHASGTPNRALSGGSVAHELFYRLAASPGSSCAPKP
jgi:hypothetical protein